jgi:hypothetical protein
VHAQNPCSAIQIAKQTTYGFRPTQLDEEGRKKKSAQMDEFWNLVKGQGNNGVTCLQDLLATEKGDGFFLFDGSSLLYTLDHSEASTRVILAALDRADLDEIDLGGYLQLLLQLSKSGIDIGPLAARYLERPNVTAIVPQHAMTVDRDIGALLLYGSMPPDRADRYLITALSDEEPYARATAARILAVSMTQESFKALSNFKGFDNLPAVYKKEIQAFRTHVPYKPPARPIKFTREQVLEYIRLIPHSEDEFMAAMKRMQEYEEQNPEPKHSPNADAHALGQAVYQKVSEYPPFVGISGTTRFIESARATLTEADLPIIREARRKSVQSLSDETIDEYLAFG